VVFDEEHASRPYCRPMAVSTPTHKGCSNCGTPTGRGGAPRGPERAWWSCCHERTHLFVNQMAVVFDRSDGCPIRNLHGTWCGRTRFVDAASVNLVLDGRTEADPHCVVIAFLRILKRIAFGPSAMFEVELLLPGSVRHQGRRRQRAPPRLGNVDAPASTSKTALHFQGYNTAGRRPPTGGW
jgi:hypothetical protein